MLWEDCGKGNNKKWSDGVWFWLSLLGSLLRKAGKVTSKELGEEWLNLFSKNAEKKSCICDEKQMLCYELCTDWWSCEVLPSRERDKEFSVSHLSKKGLVGAVTIIYQCRHEEQKNNDKGTCYSSKQRELDVETNQIQTEDKVTIFRS